MRRCWGRCWRRQSEEKIEEELGEELGEVLGNPELKHVVPGAKIMPALQPQEAQCYQTLRLCIRERAGRAVSVGAGGGAGGGACGGVGAQERM